MTKKAGFLSVFDDSDGIVLLIPITDGVCLEICMDDSQAEDLIRLIDNKLNERRFK